jgi:Asp-tRNA(Asn)/Glu-tRNA(Gln) amidotransferase A subunit family amidase
MALSWSMDKLGPICRSVEDCALVLRAIAGPDGHDHTVVDAPLRWDVTADPRRLRVGYVKALFDEAPPSGAAHNPGAEESHRHALATLDALRGLGVTLQEMKLPEMPVKPLALILTAEAASAFDALTRGGRDAELVRQGPDDWPTTFRLGQTIPATAYIQANRARTLLMREMARVTAELDAYVVPSFGGDHLLLTNLTGEPAVVVPNGFRADGTPTSITFMGRLFGEGDALAVARLYQEATGFHLKHPDLEHAAPTPPFPPAAPELDG